MIKLDPYLQIDAGTMSPFEHGETFVTKDGFETDLDLWHYERFIDEELTKEASVTTGQIYLSVIQNEREGKYLGKTVQVIPHVTNEVKDRIFISFIKKWRKIVESRKNVCIYHRKLRISLMIISFWLASHVATNKVMATNVWSSIFLDQSARYKQLFLAKNHRNRNAPIFLLPSAKGWFFIVKKSKWAAFSSTLGYNSCPPKFWYMFSRIPLNSLFLSIPNISDTYCWNKKFVLISVIALIASLYVISAICSSCIFGSSNVHSSYFWSKIRECV